MTVAMLKEPSQCVRLLILSISLLVMRTAGTFVRELLFGRCTYILGSIQL
jgi:hypothetical protein